MNYVLEYKEPVTVTLGDLIIFSVEAKNNKVYFHPDFIKMRYEEELKALNDKEVDYDSIVKLMSQVFKESSVDKFNLNYKGDDYESIIIKLFPEKVNITRESLKDALEFYKRLPSEREAEKLKELEKGNKKRTVLPIRIPPDYDWLFDALERDSKKEYGMKNLSLFAFNIIRKYYSSQDNLESSGKRSIKAG